MGARGAAMQPAKTPARIIILPLIKSLDIPFNIGTRRV